MWRIQTRKHSQEPQDVVLGCLELRSHDKDSVWWYHCVSEEDKDEDKATVWEYKYPTGQKATNGYSFLRTMLLKWKSVNFARCGNRDNSNFSVRVAKWLCTLTDRSLRIRVTEVYDSRGNRYGTIRRRLPGEKIPDEEGRTKRKRRRNSRERRREEACCVG